MKFQAFTLSELLIALAILALIASFTISKVLQSTNSGAQTAKYKEGLSVVHQVFTQGYSSGALQAAGGDASIRDANLDYFVDKIQSVRPPENVTFFSLPGRKLVLSNGTVLFVSHRTSSAANLIFHIAPDGDPTATSFSCGDPLVLSGCLAGSCDIQAGVGYPNGAGRMGPVSCGGSIHHQTYQTLF